MNVVKPNRVSHTYTQQLSARPERVFALLCPVREAEWAQGWNPGIVITASGLAERDCVFTTASRPQDSLWYVTRHEPAAGFVEMLKITPGVTACRITIQLRPVALGTEADVTYTHTSLGPQGDAFVASFTEGHYRQFMQDWESQLNRYLLQSADPVPR